MAQAHRVPVPMLHGRYADLVNGTLKIEDLDDEEISRCQLRDKGGQFRGRPPKFLPATLVNAFKREFQDRAKARFTQALYQSSIAVMREIADDPNIDPAVRLKAADMIAVRALGKPVERVEVSHADPIEEMISAIMADPDGMLESIAVPTETADA